jgi:AbrB family looped-hinge helix DNA binding protein
MDRRRRPDEPRFLERGQAAMAMELEQQHLGLHRVQICDAHGALHRARIRSSRVGWADWLAPSGSFDLRHYRGKVYRMAIAQSKVTAQGQISVPVEVRKRLGIGPGSVLEWDEEGERIVVRKAGRFSSEDIHQALFAKRPPRARKLDELKEAVRRHMREKHARR